jgi:hypothetical protein
MDPNALVIDELDAGKRLVDELRRDGLEIVVAFWARLAEENSWYLYLVSPFVDTDGAAAAYGKVRRAIRRMPELGLEPSEMKVLSPGDAMAKAAAAAIQPKQANGPFAVQNPRPFPGITRFRDTSLGGVSVDAAYIYSPPQPIASI